MGRGRRSFVVGAGSGALFAVFSSCNPKIRGLRAFGFSFDIVSQIRFWSWTSGILNLRNRDTWEELIFYMIPCSWKGSKETPWWLVAHNVVTQGLGFHAFDSTLNLNLRLWIHAPRLKFPNHPTSPPGLPYYHKLIESFSPANFAFHASNCKSYVQPRDLSSFLSKTAQESTPEASPLSVAMVGGRRWIVFQSSIEGKRQRLQRSWPQPLKVQVLIKW